MEPEEKSFEELKIFSNNVRRELIRVIGDSGSISFSLLKDELELTDGRLYFHLKKLEGYIEKDQQNFYRLNEEGKRVVFQLFHEKEGLIKDKSIETEEDKSINFLRFLAPSGIYYYLLGTKVRSFIELHILLLVICWLFGVTNSRFSPIESIFGGGAIVNSLISLAHWYVYLGIISLILWILRTKFNYFEITISVFVGIVPYIIYLIPVGILSLVGVTIPQWGSILLTILLIICKLWSTLIIAQGITITTKRQTYESILIAASLLLLDYVYLLVTL
jgi:hypothetical protein